MDLSHSGLLNLVLFALACAGVLFAVAVLLRRMLRGRSAAERLAELDALRARDAVTEQEYQRARAALLARP